MSQKNFKAKKSTFRLIPTAYHTQAISIREEIFGGLFRVQEGRCRATVQLGVTFGWTDESDITGQSEDEFHMSLPGFEPATDPFREPQGCRVHLSIGFHVS